MATGTFRIYATYRELAPVRVLVAIVTRGGSGLKVHILQIDFEVRRLVALDAWNSPMSSDEGEGCRSVVEADAAGPGISCVTRLAALRLAVGPQFGHSFREFTTVRIDVTSRAGKVRISIWSRVASAWRGSVFVTLSARCSDVTAGQRKSCGLMLCQCVRGGSKALDRVTLLATVVVRRAGELSLVDVRMAIPAGRGFDSVNGVDACRHVALLA